MLDLQFPAGPEKLFETADPRKLDFDSVQEHFSETPTTELPQLLADIDKDRPIMMYCTGGIRCDIYSTILRQKGYNNLYSLKGGVAKYLREKGGKHWRGSLFTFDDRLAVAPGEHNQASDSEVGGLWVARSYN